MRRFLGRWKEYLILTAMAIGAFYNHEISRWMLEFSEKHDIDILPIITAISLGISLFLLPKVKKWKEAKVFDKYMFVIGAWMTLVLLAFQLYVSVR